MNLLGLRNSLVDKESTLIVIEPPTCNLAGKHIFPYPFEMRLSYCLINFTEKFSFFCVSTFTKYTPVALFEISIE